MLRELFRRGGQIMNLEELLENSKDKDGEFSWEKFFDGVLSKEFEQRIVE